MPRIPNDLLTLLVCELQYDYTLRCRKEDNWERRCVLQSIVQRSRALIGGKRVLD